MELSIFKTLTSRTSCTCRFKTDCLELVLDSGATKNITGTLDYLRKQKQENGYTIATVFGQQSTTRRNSEVAAAVINSLRRLNTRFQIKTKVFRMDGDGEFLNNRLQRFVDKSGVTLELFTPYKPSENGKEERMNCLIQDTMRRLMTTAGISNRFWSFASTYSSAIWNALPRKSKKYSPYYKLF